MPLVSGNVAVRRDGRPAHLNVRVTQRLPRPRTPPSCVAGAPIFNPAMTEPPLDPWMTSSRGPFLTLNAGGTLRGIVTITALPEQGAHLVVEANWKTIHGEPQTTSASIDGYNAARELAHEWADQLAAGREPEPT